MNVSQNAHDHGQASRGYCQGTNLRLSFAALERLVELQELFPFLSLDIANTPGLHILPFLVRHSRPSNYGFTKRTCQCGKPQ